MVSQDKISKEIEERNKIQKKLFVTLENIDLIFGNNENDILCYNKILNLCRQKVTKYFGNTQDFIQKEEIAFISISRIYTAFKNKLIKKQNANQEPVLFFYLSQFYCYVDLAVRNTIIQYKKNEQKIKQNTLEYMEDVNYLSSIEDYIGHSADDFSKEIFSEKMIDKNGEVFCHNNIDNYLLDFSLENKENELNFNSFYNILNNFFNDEEIKILNNIYLGIKEQKINKKELKEKINKIRNKINSNEYLKKIILKFLKG